MAEDLIIVEGSKKAQYEALLPQIEALMEGEPNLIANLANVCAALKSQFDFLWVGFYLADGEELVLGPFQGPVACTRIKKGKGVCGKAWESGQSLVVPDVDAFPGHITCSSLSRSEIVVPFMIPGIADGVLDIDSLEYDTFDDIDVYYLKLIANMLCP